MPNLQNVPLIANGVLVVVLGACIALLLGAPVEGVLSITGNPVSRVVVVTFAMSLVGIGALSFSVHLLLHRHKRLAEELDEMRELVLQSQERTTALLSTVDGLETRVDTSLDELENEMTRERERVRAQVRAYLNAAHGHATGASEAPSNEVER